MPFATLAELKEHLTWPSGDTSNDTELTRHLNAADAMVDKKVGPSTVTSITERHGVVGGLIMLRRFPVVAVTSITPDDATALAASAYVVDTQLGGVEIKDGRPGAFTVVYTAGHSPVPDALKLATLIVAQHLYMTQHGGGGRVFPGEEYVTVAGTGFAIPRRAAELMRPYHTPEGTPGVA